MVSVLNLMKGGCDGDDAGVSEWRHGIQVLKRRVRQFLYQLPTLINLAIFGRWITESINPHVQSFDSKGTDTSFHKKHSFCTAYIKLKYNCY